MMPFRWPDKGDQRIRLKKKKLSERIKRSIGNMKYKLNERMQRKKKNKIRVKKKDIRRGRRSSSQNGKKVKTIKTRVKPKSWKLSM